MKKRWSWKIGRLKGIDTYVHVSFLLIVAWVAHISYSTGGNFGALVDGLIFLFSAFGIVVLHELGHALAARHYGIATADITLYPIGGVARLERMPKNPKQELVIALAGPAVNLVLAIGLFLTIAVIGSVPGISVMATAGGSFLARLMWLNVALLIFNMLPALPMDGGRVLRASLAFFKPHLQATIIAARVAKLMAVLFAVGGFFANQPTLMFIGLFVWFASSQEAVHAKITHQREAAARQARQYGHRGAQVSVDDLLRQIFANQQAPRPSSRATHVNAARKPQSNRRDAKVQILHDGEPINNSGTWAHVVVQQD